MVKYVDVALGMQGGAAGCGLERLADDASLLNSTPAASLPHPDRGQVDPAGGEVEADPVDGRGDHGWVAPSCSASRSVLA